MKKRPLTLLEVSIVMVLTSILLGALFYIQSNSKIFQGKIEKARSIVFARERLMMRLNQILTSDTTMRLENGFLVLEYDSGIDYERPFCGPVISLLYLEEEKICLATWPKKGEGRKEILLEKAPSLTFNFFDETENKWVESIPQEGFSLLKIKIGKEEFPFFLT